MILLASRISFVRSFVPAVRKSYTKLSYSHRLFSVGTPIDPTAQLSSLTSIQNEYQLPTVSEDRLSLRENQRLVCLGDVHGDLNALKDFLKISQVYDGDRWVGGDTILVQCGDVLDRGSEELQCFSLLTQLSRQAQEEGGRVILLWGNHEALNAAGLFQYTEGDREYEQLVGSPLDESLQTNRWRLQFAGNQPARWASFEPGGLLASPLLANMKVAVQVGKTVCVHAGLTKKHLTDWGGLEGMNRMAHDWIQADHHGGNNNNGNYFTVEQVMKDAEKRAKTHSSSMPPCLGGGIGATSPVWMRDYSSPADRPAKKEAQKLIDSCLAELDADRMVMGHTVQSHINSALGGKAWRVDIGASKGVASGTPEVLEVVQQANGKEVVSVLTKYGKIPAEDRQIDNVSADMSRYY